MDCSVVSLHNQVGLDSDQLWTITLGVLSWHLLSYRQILKIQVDSVSMDHKLQASFLNFEIGPILRSPAIVLCTAVLVKVIGAISLLIDGI